MNKKDWIDLILKAKDNVYFFWNFYVVGILAIMAWLGSLENNPRWELKLLISIAYLSFMLMNISGLLGSFSLLGAAMNDYFSAVNQLNNVTDEVEQVFRRENVIFRKVKLFRLYWVSQLFRRSSIKQALRSFKLLCTRLIDLEISRYKLVVFGLHILVDIVVLIALWCDPIWSR